MGTIILITVIGITFLLGRYALAEGQRVERHNKFMRDMNNIDTKKHIKKSIK
jgi:hypothetical protein